VGKRGGGRRHAAPVRGNPMNLRVGCGTQQAREPVGGANRRSREERQGRNMYGAGKRPCRSGRKLVGVDSSRHVDGGVVFEKPYGRRLACTSRAAARRVSDSGYASTRRVVRTHVHIARLRGTTTRSGPFTHGHGGCSLWERPHDPESRMVK
jgi:hypothetical protein